MTSKRGREIHGKAENAREDGNPKQSLILAEEAFVTYLEDGDKLGAAEVLASKMLALRHLYESTDESIYLIAAKHTAQAAVEIAEKFGDKSALALPYYNLAKIHDTLEEYGEAVDYYKKALENFQNNPPEEHKPEGRTSMVADMKVHLHVAEVNNGDDSAIERAEDALKELEEGEEILKYNKDVWLSGGFMSLADALRDKDSDKAKDYLNRAKEIIDSNDKLTIRKEQWERLASTFE